MLSNISDRISKDGYMELCHIRIRPIIHELLFPKEILKKKSLIRPNRDSCFIIRTDKGYKVIKRTVSKRNHPKTITLKYYYGKHAKENAIRHVMNTTDDIRIENIKGDVQDRKKEALQTRKAEAMQTRKAEDVQDRKAEDYFLKKDSMKNNQPYDDKPIGASA
ncbi:hypothetical protein JXB31_03685 [Candidatus Woesearchaeota archaeon]|nr:hypothetical protein [Candidatus Woesearchaeota archaeon]